MDNTDTTPIKAQSNHDLVVKDNLTEKGCKKTKLGWIPEDWEFDTIENSLIIENNLRKPISEEVRKSMQGNYPYYGPTKIQDYINEFQYEGEYALIAEDGDHFLKYKDFPMTQLVYGKFNVNNHAHAIKGTAKCTTKWFYWFYNRRSIFSHLTRQGAGRYKLNKASLSKMKIAYPRLKEQNMIIEILETWDFAIQNLDDLITKKELQKKGLMQQLLTGKTRLKRFEDDWRLIKFRNIYKPKKVKAGDKKYLVLSVTKNGIVSQADYFNKEIASADTSPYLVVEKGDLAMSGLNFWMGAVDVLEDYEIGIISPAYKVFQIKNPEIDHLFMRYFVRSECFLKALVGASVQGASVVRRNLDKESLEEWDFKLPAMKEQNAIAKTLQCADKELTTLIQKLNFLKEQKKGLMQQLLTGKKRLKF